MNHQKFKYPLAIIFALLLSAHSYIDIQLS